MHQSTTLQPPAFVDLNVLPDELRPRRDSVWFVLGVVAILSASILLIPLYQARQAGVEETALLNSELALMHEELTRIQVDFGRARELREQIETTGAAIAALDEERQAVLGDRQQVSVDLAAILRALPPGARLASVTGSGGQLSLQGRSDRAADVLDYSRALGGEKFLQARIVSLAVEGNEDQDTGMTFVIQLTQQAQGR